MAVLGQSIIYAVRVLKASVWEEVFQNALFGGEPWDSYIQGQESSRQPGAAQTTVRGGKL